MGRKLKTLNEANQTLANRIKTMEQKYDKRVRRPKFDFLFQYLRVGGEEGAWTRQPETFLRLVLRKAELLGKRAHQPVI